MRTVKPDVLADLHEITHTVAIDMEKMGPFGIGNPRPIVQVMRAKVCEVYAMGNKGTHLSLKVGGERIRCVWWGQGELVEKIACGSRVDIVGKIKANEFRGHHSAEIEIIDLKLPSA